MVAGKVASKVEVRRASRADVQVLAELAARTFRETFASANTEADMVDYLAEAFSPSRMAAEFEDPASVFLLAGSADESAPIGYAKLRAAEPDPSVSGASPIEIERLYVDRPAIGRGVGGALMRACLEEAALGGYETVWLGVWELNDRAIEFYRRWRFEEVGDHLFRLGGDEQRDLIFQRAV